MTATQTPRLSEAEVSAALNAHIDCQGSLTDRMNAALTAAAELRAGSGTVHTHTVDEVVKAAKHVVSEFKQSTNGVSHQAIGLLSIALDAHAKAGQP